jgi:hypothetical protein
MRRSDVGFALLLALLVAGTVAACFSPQQPACAFSCVDGGSCPTAYVCGSDGLCHRADGQGQCLLDPAVGGARPDGAADGTTETGP